MDYNCFESKVCKSDDEDNLSFSVDVKGSQQSSMEGNDKLDLEGYGKAVIFGRRRCSTQEAVNEKSEADREGNRSEATQSFSDIGGTSQGERAARSSQDKDIPDFDSKDKMYWYVEFKRQRFINKKLEKRISSTNTKIKEISAQVKILVDILNK